jgi:hypothetical protein
VSAKDDPKHAIVVGPKFMGVLARISEDTGMSEGVVLKRALAMYRAIKEYERQGYKPCMLKDRTARLLDEVDL